MAGPDLSVFDRIKTKADYDREAEIFDLKRLAMEQAKNGNIPAALQIADRLTELRASADPTANQQIQDIQAAQKITRFDPGVYMNGGMATELPGYSEAIGGIEGTKKSYEANAQNESDLYYDPQIASGEAKSRQQQELAYANQIANQKKAGEINATQIGDLQKKADTAHSMSGNTQRAREILQTGAPTGSYGGAALNFGKRIIGVSDETTQANAKLDAIAGYLTANVPRMEGPQSDADRVYYQQMAGRVGDKTMPPEDRVAALDEIDKINAKYANLQTPQSQIFGQQINQGSPIVDQGFGFPDVANGQQYPTPEAVDPRNIPMDAVQELRADPSPEAIMEFEQVFGKGAASMVGVR
jgi:hypothetical protein